MSLKTIIEKVIKKITKKDESVQNHVDNNGFGSTEHLLKEEIYNNGIFAEEKLPRTELIPLSKCDTVIVPAQDAGFEKVFIGENCWYEISIKEEMLSKLKYIGAYRVDPISAITHIAPIDSIAPYKDTNKYIIYFSRPAMKIATSLKLVPKAQKGKMKAIRARQYTTIEKLMAAKNLDDVFIK